MDGDVSPRVAALRANPAASEGDAHLAAELLLELYQAHSSGASDLLIMMSQLQVCAFTPIIPLIPCILPVLCGINEYTCPASTSIYTLKQAL